MSYFQFPTDRDQFCPLQRTSMQNILIIVHVTSSNINKNYKQYPVKLIILRNKNIILCNQVCIGRHRNFQSIPNTHQQSYTLVLLNNSYQWLHYGFQKDSICHEQIIIFTKHLTALFISNYALMDQNVLQYHSHYYQNHLQLLFHLPELALLGTLWITPNTPSQEHTTDTSTGVNPLLSPTAEKYLQQQDNLRVPSTYVQYVRYLIRSNFSTPNWKKIVCAVRARVRNSMMYSGDAYMHYMLILSCINFKLTSSSSLVHTYTYSRIYNTRREVNSQFKPPITLKRDEVNMRGKLYRGGTCELKKLHRDRRYRRPPYQTQAW